MSIVSLVPLSGWTMIWVTVSDDADTRIETHPIDYTALLDDGSAIAALMSAGGDVALVTDYGAHSDYTVGPATGFYERWELVRSDEVADWIAKIPEWTPRVVEQIAARIKAAKEIETQDK